MRFDNFTRATCILYIDLVETLNFQLRCLVEKVAHINNRKTVCANSLVTAHSLRVCLCHTPLKHSPEAIRDYHRRKGRIRYEARKVNLL